MLKAQIITLFSQQRLNGYKNHKEHEDNFCLIGSIARKIGLLEIIIRNKINSTLSTHNPQWLILLLGTGFQSLSADELLAKQSMGIWLKVVEHYKIANQIFCNTFLDSLDFKKYYEKNPKRFPSTHIMRHQKCIILLKLLHLLRNRAFHFENLYKMNVNGPRLSITICNSKAEKLIFSLEPQYIHDFLNDLLNSFGEDLIDYGS